MNHIPTYTNHHFIYDHGCHTIEYQPETAEVLPMASKRKSLGFLQHDLRGLCGAVDAGSGHRERALDATLGRGVNARGKPWENHRKTIGKWWFHVILWDLPSGYVKISIENGHRNSGFTH